jgi:hypothetical protein
MCTAGYTAITVTAAAAVAALLLLVVVVVVVVFALVLRPLGLPTSCVWPTS